MPEERDYVLVDRIARLAGRLGMNEVRVRWKLLAMARKREEAAERARVAAEHVPYEHAVCGHCGRINPRGTRTCIGCESRIEPRWVQMLRRAGLHAPVPLSVSTLIGLVLLVAFVRVGIASGSWLGFDGTVLLEHGAHAPWLERMGQWWRLGTAVLLHGGLFHLLFNAFALAQVGPQTEDVFGPGRTLAFFLLMGTVANVPALLIDRPSIGVGASGAILGLAGLAAGWGQREGTSNGRRIRNAMLSWLLYATVFGVLMRGVDHLAHVTGFLTGAVLGYAFHGVKLRQGWGDAAWGLTGFVALVALLVMVLVRHEPVTIFVR